MLSIRKRSQSEEVNQVNPNLKYASVQSFEEDVVRSELPVFVDFYADWCGPCRAVAPTVEELSKDYEGKVSFVKVNVDENADLAAKFDIHTIPTLMIFRNGKPVTQYIGSASKRAFQNMIEKALLNGSR